MTKSYPFEHQNDGYDAARAISAKEACRNCVFFGNPGCRRHAPVSAPPDDSMNNWPLACWPRVSHDDWCGDFERSDRSTQELQPEYVWKRP